MWKIVIGWLLLFLLAKLCDLVTFLAVGAIRFCPYGIHTLLSLWNLPWRPLELSSLVKKFAVDPVWILSCCRDTWRSILFLTVGFIGLRCVVPLSVQEKMGLFVGRTQRIFSLCLPSSAHLSASSFRGSPRCAFILMKIVRRPCSILSRRSCIMSHMMSASGFPCIEGNLPSPIHFWEEERKQAESDRRIIGYISCFLLASSSARHAAPNSALLVEFLSSPLPSRQHPPLFSSSLK